MGKVVSKIFGGGEKPPPVVQPAPIVDQAKIDADAAAKAAQGKSQRRRMARASSLLATGGGGDLSSPVTGLPSAQSKSTLGG
jgi:hypothetical protein